MSANKSSTLEKIREVNPGGISDNMVSARLSRILGTTSQEQKALSTPSPHQETDLNRQKKAREELGQLLSKGNPEKDRQQLKQEYLEQYLIKFGLEQPKSQPSQTNQRVIAKLEQFKELQKAALTHTEQPSISSLVKGSFNRAIESLKNPNELTQNKDPEKKSFIRVVIDRIITKGKSLANQKSEYENEGYKALLQVEHNKQILSIDRKQPQPNQPNPAFKAQKEGTDDFRVLQDNLSEQELKDVITSNQPMQPQPQQLQPPTRTQQKQDLKNKGPELD